LNAIEQLLTQNHLLGGVHPMKLEKMFRRVHTNSANLFHGWSPLFEICNDLILAQSMPSGAVHPNTLALNAVIRLKTLHRLVANRAAQSPRRCAIKLGQYACINRPGKSIPSNIW
jgi:hypothetical protein